MTGRAGHPRRKVESLVPLVGWIRSYDRSWLRGDLIAGVTVAALIVPKNLGYAGIAGIPLQNGLYAAAAGALLYAVFGTSRQISMGPSSGLAAVAASAVLAAGITDEHDVASFVAAITLASGLVFLAPRRSADGLDRAVPVSGGGYRVPVRGRDRRRDRRAPQAHRDRCHRDEQLAGAVVLARDGRRRARVDRRRRAGLAGRRLRSAGVSHRVCRARWFWSSAGCWPRVCSTWARMGLPWSAPCREDCPRSRSLTPSSHGTTPACVAAAAVALVHDRVLADCG